ncbi:MAG: hypothetical protein JKY42_00550, partial [Flavobacteriales bacterium]|nr:hypothetical protein [Flavobacteriales bacterium]
YFSKGNRFIQLSNYRFTRYSSKENGGLYDDTGFEDNFTDKLYIPMNLLNASNTVRAHELSFENYFRVSKADSISKDEGVYLFGTAKLRDSKQIYSDSNADSIYYLPFTINEGSSIYDSLHYQTFSWNVGWQNYSPLHASRRVLASVFGGYEFNRFSQNNLENQIHTGLISMRLSTNPKKKLIADYSVQYYFLGYRSNNITMNISLGSRVDSLQETKLWFSGYYNLANPNYSYYLYSSDPLVTNLNKIRTINLGLNFSNDKLKNKISVNYSSLKNVVYLDSLYRVTQYTERTGLLKASVRQHLSLKKIHLSIQLLYQKVLGEDVFRVPEFVTFNSLYFESHLFKRATLMRMGVDFYYNTAYYGNGYLPMYRSFYLQNEKQIGNYPYIDVFITAQIKKARVYAKVSHVNSGLSGNTYYSSLHYPMADRMLRLGVDWTFWD